MKLLKESFEAGVIDAEEYRRNKEKVEQEMEKTRWAAEEPKEARATISPEKTQEKEIQEEQQETPAPEQEEPLTDSVEEDTTEKELVPEEEQTTLETAQAEEKEEQETQEPAEEQPEPQAKKQNDVDILIEEAESGVTQEQKPEQKIEQKVEHVAAPTVRQDNTDDSAWNIVLWVIGILALLGVLMYFSFSPEKMNLDETLAGQEAQNPRIACTQHADCVMPSMEAKCVNGGKTEASCQYQNATSIELTILGSGECISCSSERMKNILMSWFPGANINEISSSSMEGKALRAQHSIEMLPAYMLDSNVKNTLLFEDVKNALRKSGNDYVVKDSASGAPLFLNRNNVAGQVDVFLSPDDDSSQRAILNLEEFSTAFGNEATMVYHIVKDSNASKIAACVSELAPQRATEYILCDAKSDEDCAATLGLGTAAINSCVEEDSERIIQDNAALQSSLGFQMPSFLINNRMRVSGVQAADSLREQFCSMNDAAACSKELKKSLV